jgi:hypothetical protein
MNDRKKRIMEHLTRSLGKYPTPAASSQNSDARKQQVLDHVRRTQQG